MANSSLSVCNHIYVAIMTTLDRKVLRKRQEARCTRVLKGQQHNNARQNRYSKSFRVVMALCYSYLLSVKGHDSWCTAITQGLQSEPFGTRRIWIALITLPSSGLKSERTMTKSPGETIVLLLRSLKVFWTFSSGLLSKFMRNGMTPHLKFSLCLTSCLSASERCCLSPQSLYSWNLERGKQEDLGRDMSVAFRSLPHGFVMEAL